MAVCLCCVSAALKMTQGQPHKGTVNTDFTKEKIRDYMHKVYIVDFPWFIFLGSLLNFVVLVMPPSVAAVD